MVKRAAAANATAVLIASNSSTLQLLQCVDAECDDQSFGLPAVSVSLASGSLLRKHAQAKGSTVSLSFSTEEQCGTTFGVDSGAKLVQTWGGSGLGNPTDATCVCASACAPLPACVRACVRACERASERACWTVHAEMVHESNRTTPALH